MCVCVCVGVSKYLYVCVCVLYGALFCLACVCFSPLSSVRCCFCPSSAQLSVLCDIIMPPDAADSTTQNPMIIAFPGICVHYWEVSMVI